MKYLLITSKCGYHGYTSTTETICSCPDDVTYRLKVLKEQGHSFVSCYQITGEKLIVGTHWERVNV